MVITIREGEVEGEMITWITYIRLLLPGRTEEVYKEVEADDYEVRWSQRKNRIVFMKKGHPTDVVS